MRRFYKAVSAAEVKGGFGVTLDGRPLKTPAKNDLVLPTMALAVALAAEWEAQGEQIKPAEMQMMQLVSTSIDRVSVNSQPLLNYLAGFGSTDLLCHRAEHPLDLVALQGERWQPWLDWAETQGIRLIVADGIVAVEQPADSLARLRAVLETYDHWRLTALQSLAPALGSIILSLAVAERALDAETAFGLSQLDENFQAERWGLDLEAVQRQQGLRREVGAAARYLDLLTGASS
jgi:chaperone required for assembly of F1-ATPase